jgi:hypothetical protein
MGHALVAVGDVDGRGQDDLFLGACCGPAEERGLVYLMSGEDLPAEGTIDLNAWTQRWEGEEDGDQAGFQLGSAGDVDGDGLPDLLVGARQNSGGGTDAGKAYLLLSDGLSIASSGALVDADAIINGTHSGAQLGYSLTAAGDVDGDGFGDILVGAYLSSVGADMGGEVLLFGGDRLVGNVDETDANMRITGTEPNQIVGVSLAGDMDLDGDGAPDIVIGASGLGAPVYDHGEMALTGMDDGGDTTTAGMDSAGEAYLFWGTRLESGTFTVRDADWVFNGEVLHDHAGIRLNSPGDVDGDGLDDLLIGTERGQSGVGRAFLLTDLGG